MNTNDLSGIAIVENETAKHSWETGNKFSWDQENVLDREIRFIPRKIKETIHSLKNSNYINKISNLR